MYVPKKAASLSSSKVTDFFDAVAFDFGWHSSGEGESAASPQYFHNGRPLRRKQEPDHVRRTSKRSSDPPGKRASGESRAVVTNQSRAWVPSIRPERQSLQRAAVSSLIFVEVFP
jgi:hypothetical protein